jgi:hypothetical protein
VNIDWLAVGLGTVAFFIVGAIWFGLLFRRTWSGEAGLADPLKGGAQARIMGLTLLCEFIIVLTLGHLFAFLQPSDHVKMMISTGFGLAIMTPAIGINYLHQRRSLKLFLIDASHFIVGMAAAGMVFVLLG